MISIAYNRIALPSHSGFGHFALATQRQCIYELTACGSRSVGNIIHPIKSRGPSLPVVDFPRALILAEEGFISNL